MAHLKSSLRDSLLIKELKWIMWSGKRNERKKMKLQSSVAAQIMHIMFYGVPKRIQHLCFTGAVIAYEFRKYFFFFFWHRQVGARSAEEEKRTKDVWVGFMNARPITGVHYNLA